VAAVVGLATLPGAASSEPGPRLDFFVFLSAEAELGATGRTHTDRVRHVVDTKKAHADRSQAGLRAVLAERGADFTPFWIANAVKVTGDRELMADLARRADVDRVVPDRAYPLAEPVRTAPAAPPDGVEWNVGRIRAPEVWEAFGDRGQGVVVGTIDTGAQSDHPALARQYRGPGHDHNWYDPTGVCGDAPCDNVGHGTHVLGTILGDDGAGNRTGAAPAATWIAAKGCETRECSATALLAAGQWMLAPTDAAGRHPRPDLAPHVINNSWGGGPGDPFYDQMVEAWTAAGIFPVFAAGNDGPGCGSAWAPGDQSYAVGAFDDGNRIAEFSGRGPGRGGAKPDVTAPGVRVRSSVPGGRYESWDGTSMAAPHVTATVALLWSLSDPLRGEVAETRDLIGETATPVDDRGCGGTPEHNNVWGRGRLDAFAAVSAAPRGAVGVLTGVVRGGGVPLAGAEVRVAGPLARDTTTGDAGEYRLTHLSAGSYDVSVRGFGYLAETVRAVVTEGETTTLDVDLDAAPRHTVSGRVRDDDGEPVRGAVVRLAGTPLPAATTGDDGAYRVPDVPAGSFEVLADAGGCLAEGREHVEVAGDVVVDLTLADRTDGYGHVCATAAPSWVAAGTPLPLAGPNGTADVDLPFPVTLYGESYTSAHVSVDGYLSFTTTTPYHSENTPIPGAEEPNAAVYAFWDDLVVDAGASVRTGVTGAAPDRSFVVEWRNVAVDGWAGTRLSFAVVLSERGQITVQYRGIGDDPVERGASATVGVENGAGTDAFQYSADRPVLADGTAITFRVPGTGLVRGVVTDANDQRPAEEAVATISQAGQPDQVVRADRNGVYQARVRVGGVSLRLTAPHYSAEETTLRVDREEAVVTHDAVLRTGRVAAQPDALELVVPSGQSRTRAVTVANTGGADVSWQARLGGGTAGEARVLRSWPVRTLQLVWGVGYRDGPWLSEQGAMRNGHFTDGGTLDRLMVAPWTGGWPADMAYLPDRDLMCQVRVGGDNGIHCWHPETGAPVASIAGTFPWTRNGQRGLAYRPDDDTFYVAGWEGVVYHVRGLSHSVPGEVLDRCQPDEPNISGLGWNTAFGVLWAATNSSTDTIHGLDPSTCDTVRTVAAPDTAAFTGGGLETDPAGNLWTVSQGTPATVYQIDSGLPDFHAAPWLRVTQGSGTLSPGATATLTVEVDTTGLAPGEYRATVMVTSDSGRERMVAVPVRVVVPAYRVGVNAGGGAHTDGDGDAWVADRAYTPGGYGHLSDRSRVDSTKRTVAGTTEQPLYQNLRLGAYEHRFDGVPNGTYTIELEFAEVRQTRPNTRLFDVIAEDTLLLPALDVAGAVGSFTALERTVRVTVTDGQLNVRLVSRSGDPIVNALRVTHRPDLN
jgi:hypothetical protein